MSAPPRRRRVLAAVVVLAVGAAVSVLAASPPASATDFSGTFSPTVFDNKLDLNGDNEVTTADASNEYLGSTSIIDGRLDCDSWGGGTSNGGNASENNAGTAGDLTIDSGDDCTLIAYDGTDTGKHIQVSDGFIGLSDGPMPAVYPNCDGTGGCNDSSVVNAKFAWETIGGRVDTDGNGQINGNDCHVGIIGPVNILSNTAGNANPCGFGTAPADSSDGLVDLNHDNVINSSDTCSTGCFFRHNVTDGFVQEIPSPPNTGSAFTGTFGPTAVNSLADVNGDGVANSSDDSNEFFGRTSIINGALDCNNWGATENDGSAGDGVIDATDDCNLRAYNGTPTGQLIQVIDGEFQISDGPMPTIYPDPSTPNDPSVRDAKFAWEAIGGRVDTNGNTFIDSQDCAIDLVGSIDVLANTQDDSNPCGFAVSPSTSSNGKVDKNGDSNITSADSCNDGCFFGHDLKSGLVVGHGIDFNFDAKSDILWHNRSTGKNAVWFMDVANFLGAAAVNHTAATSWKPYGLADFNGDGNTDILWHNTGTGKNSVWFLNGTTYIGNTAIDVTAATSWTPFATIDFDGDGNPDILWHNNSSGANSVWYMNGTDVDSFDAITTTAALSWEPIDAADFDGDGQPDLLWHNDKTGANSVWIMNGTDVASFESINKTAALSWHPYAARDFDNDGDPDILWHNTATGKNSIWILDGTDYVIGLAVNKTASLAWTPL